MKTPALSVSLRQDGGLHEGAGRKGTPSSMQRNASGSAAVPLWDTGKGNGRNGKASDSISRGVARGWGGAEAVVDTMW